jgi:hypothetical protein
MLIGEKLSAELLKEAFASMPPGDQASYVLDVAHYGRGFMKWTEEGGYVYVSLRDVYEAAPPSVPVP